MMPETVVGIAAGLAEIGLAILSIATEFGNAIACSIIMMATGET
jgi:hypothetical protein